MDMNGSRESRQADIAFMLAGPIAVATGFLFTRQDIPYPAGDPRGEPWYGLVVFAISIVIGLTLFVIGFVRLMQSRKHDGS
jgi:hypothetical protein